MYCLTNNGTFGLSPTVWGFMDRNPNHLPERPNPSTALPPELVGEILNHLHHDKKALQNCSLVAKSWTYLSQEGLFTSVDLTPEVYQAWRENPSPKRVELLQHVRALACYDLHSVRACDCFASLHRLQHLALNGSVGIHTIIRYLAPIFRNTLSSLSLRCVWITWGTFVMLVDYFPSLRHLHLSKSILVGDNQDSPPLSRPLRGKLEITSFPPTSMDSIVRGLSKLKLECSVLKITRNLDRPPSRVQPIVSACRKTLTCLTLTADVCKLQSYLHRTDVTRVD